RGRAALHILQRQARECLEQLRAQLAALQAAARGTPDEGRFEPGPARETTVNPVLSRGRALLDRDADEKEVIREGLAVGWEAHTFYLERSEAAPDPASRAVYAGLAREEKGRHARWVAAYETMIGRR